MKIPNIGYEANSIYERDAIFDELEKMGFYVETKELRNFHLSICPHKGLNKFWANDCTPDVTLPRWYPTPESFLTAAREALKPKYPTETLHAKCNSPFELRGCVQALHEAGVNVYPSSMPPNISDCIVIIWDSNAIDVAGENWHGNHSRELPLSEFMDIFLKPGKAEPKRETPPKIVGRKYRVAIPQPKHSLGVGEVVKLKNWSCGDMAYVEKADGGVTVINFDRLELLPEEPWTAEYKKGDDACIFGKVFSADQTGVTVSIPCHGTFTIYASELIRKA